MKPFTNPSPFNNHPFLQKHGDFQTAFNPLPKVNYNSYDFTNKDDILYNNLDSNLLREEIREYSVMIDSKDRNYQVYPDPFNYEVRFNPLPKSRENVNGRYIIHEEPAPIINESFSNVKYIKLESSILPLFNRIKQVEEKEDDEIIKRWKVDTSKSIIDDMYTMLSIGEHSDTNYKSTNDALSDSFAVIYLDKQINNTHFHGYSRNGVKVFPHDNLAKLDRLKISFMDPYGIPLKCKHVDKKIKSNMECFCEDPEGDDDTDCFKHNIHHPLNPIFQHHLHFKIGVIEPRLNKIIFK